MTDAVAYPKQHVPAGEDFLLLSPTAQAHAYRNVDRMFATRPIRRGLAVLQLERGKEISPSYQPGQGLYGVDAYMDRANVAGLLVIKQERIVLERYSLGLEENLRWSSMSMIKSLTGTLVGAALQQGAIASLDDAVSKYIPALRGCAYDAVTVRNLITMSSGVRWNEDYTDRNSDVNRYSKSLGDKIPGGVLALMRSLKAEHRPGSQFNYNTGDTYVLGGLISAATEKPWPTTCPRRSGLASAWSLTRSIRWNPKAGRRSEAAALESRCGILAASVSFSCGTALSMARPYFLRTGSTMRAAQHSDFDPATNRYGATGYGYSWWIDPDGSMVAVGFAGQSLYVNRKDKVVIVTLSCQPQPPYSAAYGVDLQAEYHAFKEAVVAELG